MKSVFNATVTQSIIGDNGWSNTVGFIYIYRNINQNSFKYAYSDGASMLWPSFADFF
jgi:hypothetical protein